MSSLVCLADELAEQRPHMNIKVTAFTVSEKSINKAYISIPVLIGFRYMCQVNKDRGILFYYFFIYHLNWVNFIYKYYCTQLTAC